MKRPVSLLLLLFLVLGFFSFIPETARAARRVRRHRIYRKYRRMPLKAYYKYTLNPAVKEEDASRVSESLKGQGVDSVQITSGGGSLILKFKASAVSAVDLMQTLKRLGYTVTGIN